MEVDVCTFIIRNEMIVFKNNNNLNAVCVLSVFQGSDGPLGMGGPKGIRVRFFWCFFVITIMVYSITRNCVLCCPVFSQF